MDNEREQIAKMYDEGMSMRSIARKMNKHPGSISSIVQSLIKYGRCIDKKIIEWQDEMYEQGCNVIPAKKMGEVPYVEKKKLEDYPLVVVRGKTYRDVTDSLYYSTKYKNTYLSEGEKQIREEREREGAIKLKKKMKAMEKDSEIKNKYKGDNLSKKLLEERENDICKELNAGNSKASIIRRYGLTYTQIDSIINKLNFEGRYGPENLVTTKEEMESVKRYLEEGLTRQEISEKLGTHAKQIKLVCDRLIMQGEVVDAYSHNRRDSLTKEERAQIIKLRKQGLTYEKISHEVDRSYSFVWNVVLQAIQEGELVE